MYSAVDNQVYFGMCSPARDMTAGYHAVSQALVVSLHNDNDGDFLAKPQWGHSMMLDPMYVLNLCSILTLTLTRRY